MKRLETTRLGNLIGCGAIALLALGCRQAPWLDAAQRGSLPELQKSVERADREGELDSTAIEELAVAVLRREIQSATDPEGELLLESLTDCARTLEKPLRKRSERRDETSGVALYLLVDSGHPLSPAEWDEASTSPRGSRRAAAALDTHLPERFAQRERFLNDADPRVRRAALRSVALHPSPLHWDTLVAMLRRDPDPSCRRLAAESIGIIGGSDADSVLWDAWARADRDLRLALVSGWANARTFAAGGQARLVAIARSEPGSVGAVAAATLATGISAVSRHGQARVTRSLESGSDEERAIALMAARWDSKEQADQILRLGLHGSPLTRVRALDRWLQHPAHRWPALTWLRQLAIENDSHGLLARELLAKSGDASVRLLLRNQLEFARWQTRVHAASALLLLGDTNGVARALADDAPEARVVAACAILSRASSEQL